MFGLELEREGEHFVFSDLVGAPDYSIAGAEYLLATPATTTFAGKPWEVFEANGFVYNYDTGLLVPIESVTASVSLSPAGNYYLAQGLILPGSLTDRGDRVKDYAAWFSTDTMKFRYSEVTFV
jgi:hypothetical protein